jgi:hypothetical protein
MVLPGWDGRRAWLIIGALLVNLFVANMGTNLSDFGPARKTLLAPEMVAVQDTVAAPELPGRVYNEFRLYEDYAIRLGVEDVWGSSPLRLARYAALFDNFPLDRMWRLTGVETVLTWRRELFVPSALLAEFPQATDTTYLHTLSTPATTSNPRAWLVTNVQVADDATVLPLLADHTVDLAQIAFLPPELLANETTMDPGAYAIQLARLSPQALQINVRSERGGLLVVSENWLPGWQVVDFDCRSAPTERCLRATGSDDLPLLQPLRANLTLIGIIIPPGAMTFTLRYWPLRVQLGLWISGGTLLLLICTLLWRWQRQRAVR